jgi:hypothetical protein
MTLTPERMMETVLASPACVARHDKQAWLDLFTTDAVIEDPVGSAPCRRGQGIHGDPPDDELGQFWETFIGPNDIRFEVRQDLCSGCEVLRDVVIHTTLSTGLSIDVPTLVRYELAEEADRVRIRRLSGHWEAACLSLQAARSGWTGLVTVTLLGARLVRFLGLRGTLGYSRALLGGIGGRGRDVVAALAAGVHTRDGSGLSRLLVSADTSLEWPAGRPIALEEWLAALPSGAELEVEQVMPAGWTTTFRFRRVGPDPVHGIGLLRFDPGSGLVRSARFYLADATQKERP